MTVNTSQYVRTTVHHESTRTQSASPEDGDLDAAIVKCGGREDSECEPTWLLFLRLLHLLLDDRVLKHIVVRTTYNKYIHTNSIFRLLYLFAICYLPFTFGLDDPSRSEKPEIVLSFLCFNFTHFCSSVWHVTGINTFGYFTNIHRNH